MSKSISYSNHNISTTQDHSNALSAFLNTSKIFKTKKVKIVSLSSTPNALNQKNFNSFCCATINNTFSNERGKERKKSSIPMSLSGKSSKRYFSISQGHPYFSKSFYKKYIINKSNKGNFINYLEPKDNKYIGIDLNLVSNSSRRKTSDNKIFPRDEINIKNFNNNDIYDENILSPRKNENDSNRIKDNSYLYEDENEEKKINKKESSCNINKKIELNSSTSSHIRQNSHLENASMNQSTPVSSFHPYEADSSPTNYIKSYSNINNLTYLTNNNSKKYNNKNDEEDEKRSISHFGFNHSEFTCLNNSNKISEKEDERRIGDKLDKINKIKRNKNNRKKKKNEILIKDNNYNTENININDSYLNINTYKNNENIALHNTIEEKEEEYLNSITNKLKISKEKKENLEEMIKNSKDQDTIYHLKKTEENEKDELEKEEIRLIKELEKEKEMNRKEEERINYLKKENEDKELKKKEIKEIKNKIKKEQILRKNLEKKSKLLEMKLKKDENKDIYEEDNKNKNIEIKDTNFMNNVNQVTFNVPKSTINAKLNFNYYSGINNENEKAENFENKVFMNPINFINLKEEKNNLKEEKSTSYFYDYGSNTIVNTGILNGTSSNKNKGKLNSDNNKIENQNFIIKNNDSNNNIYKNNPEKQFQFEIKPSEESKKKYNNITFTSFNFGLIQNNNSNNKRKMIKKSLMNDNINIMKENYELNFQKTSNSKNTLEHPKEIKEKTMTKDASTQYYQEILNKNNKSNLFLRNYMTSLGNNNNFLKTEFKTEFLSKTKSILFDLDSFKTNYTINNIPHHNNIERNKGTIWNEYSMKNNSNISKIGKTEETNGFFSINRQSKNKFNRKINSFVFPANPFDSVNKAREYYFFNN